MLPLLFSRSAIIDRTRDFFASIQRPKMCVELEWKPPTNIGSHAFVLKIRGRARMPNKRSMALGTHGCVSCDDPNACCSTTPTARTDSKDLFTLGHVLCLVCSETPPVRYSLIQHPQRKRQREKRREKKSTSTCYNEGWLGLTIPTEGEGENTECYCEVWRLLFFAKP